MPSDPPPKPRRRGRPPRAEAKDRRAAILAAATEEFAAEGYEATSLRSVARRAGVDPALVHHYFDNKADLFAQTVQAPLRPDRILAGLVEGPSDDLGPRLIRTLLQHWDDRKLQKPGLAILRRALGHRAGAVLLREFLSREVFARVARAVGSDDAEVRASLVASQVIGVIVGRYVLALPHLAGVPVETLVERVGPILQHYLTGPLGELGVDRQVAEHNNSSHDE